MSALAEADPRAGAISVIIPTHNRAFLLGGAVASVLRSRLIDSPDRIIVVDDDSTDQTRLVVRQYGVRCLHVAVHGPSGSRNAGLALADTEYVTFLDDDDAWLPGNMEAQLAALEADPKAAFAYGIAQCATEEDLAPLPTTFPVPPLATGRVPGLLHTHYPQLGVVLFRRAAIAEAGGFDPSVNFAEDADLMLRIAASRPIVGIEVVGMLYRLRAPSKARCDYFWAVRKVTRWRPRGQGVGWPAAFRFQILTRRLFFIRFCEDAAASTELGNHAAALVCAGRAVWVSPLHAIRHARMLAAACR